MARNRTPSPDVMSRQSGSPAPMPQSKRDKRRAMLSERLQELVSSFNANVRPHYEAQANALQVDINLIHNANPYENKPLEDSPEEITNLIRSKVGGRIPADPVAEADFLADSGRLYTKFVHEVNDALEDRDVNLTLLHNKHRANAADLEQRYAFYVRMAHEEHRLLANTIRERLTAQLSRKRDKLLKEKDMLDIGDSNALLLHPNQYSLINPASPGTGHKRATRNTGRRGGDLDEPSEGRRKRQRLFDETDGQSPALGPTRVDVGIGSPYRDARAKASWHQQEAPLYSMDKLFTEKELGMTMNTAAIAARHFLLKPQLNGQVNGNGVNGTHADHEDGPDSGTPTANEADQDDDAAPAAPAMERGASTSHHATRGTTKALAGLGALSAGDVPLGTIIPTFMPATFGAKANGAVTSVSQLSASEIDSDLAMMFRDTRGEDDTNDKLLERTLGPQPVAEYQYRPPMLANGEAENTAPSLLAPILRVGDLPTSNMRSTPAPLYEAPPMSRSNSTRGVAMQRTGSNMSRRGR